MQTSSKKARQVCRHQLTNSPIGKLKLVATDDALAAILWKNDDPRKMRLHITHEDDGHAVLIEAERQLKQYFAGE